jgi:hypothetical protein
VNGGLTPEFQSYAQDLVNSGYPHAQSQALAEALFNSRQVINARHKAYTDRLNDDRLANMSFDALVALMRSTEHPGIVVNYARSMALVTFIARLMAKDNDLVGLLYEKFEAHRKLMRYEQRVFNRLRRISQIKK